jgi:hypothetical protein
MVIFLSLNLEKLPELVLQEILDFVQFLQTKHQQNKTLEIMIMSKYSLQKDCLKREKDAALQNL